MTAELYCMTGGVLRQAARAQVQGRSHAPQSAGLTCRGAYLPGTIPQPKSQLLESSVPSRRVIAFAPSRRHSLRLNPPLRVAAAEPEVQATQSTKDFLVPYETMLVLRPDMSEEERDVELAKFEAFLVQEGAQDIKALVRNAQSLAYPIKGYWEAVYVLYNYTGKRSISQAVQKLLSTPTVGTVSNVLRHMTFVN